MTDTPEDWVLIEAAKRCDYVCDIDHMRLRYECVVPYRALCNMIAKHEQPQVDRKLLCAREAVREMRRRDGDNVCLGVRAIELYLEGFGE